MTIPDSAIRLSYLWPCNAAMAVFQLNNSYRSNITVTELKAKWAKELEQNTPLRELGERPEKGFVSSEKVKIVKRLVA